MRMTIIGTKLTLYFSYTVLKTSILLCLLLVSQNYLRAQRPQYMITAVLDPGNHTVKGTIDITYTNHAQQEMDSLGIHLWPNAYNGRNTALVKQMLNLGNLKLYRAPHDELGSIDSLHFTSPDQEIYLNLDVANIDIGWLHLVKSLAPGSMIHLSTPYVLKVPISFSRIGRTGDSYQLTQWYPHLAVFDKNGWHTMPYLDQGEYFNDFADYEVHIQTPKDYIVAATGTMTSSLKEDTRTQWVFKAKDVIDFAWFASPNFRQEKYTVDVGGNHTVELNVYVDPLGNGLWSRAHVYAERALKFYSDWLGPYPYSQMSVVYAPLSKGGYMEYPMVAQINLTLDSALLDIAIAHEIGHTWLYGVLANDERTNPWMDEGLNTFLERRYTEIYQPKYQEVIFPSIFMGQHSMSQNDAFQHLEKFTNEMQPPQSNPQFQSSDQYLFSAYNLPPQGLEIIMAIHGEGMMKQMFRQYFLDHQFNHVSPDDLKNSFEKVCGCDLSWFFDEWIHHAPEVDYRIKHFNARKKEVTIQNKSHIQLPLQISTYRDGRPVLNRWIDGFEDKKIIHLDDHADEVQLYEDNKVINKNWKGNIKPGSFFPSFTFLPKIGSYGTSTIGITPFFGRNLTDGFMPGIAFTSDLLPQPHLKWILAPMYGLESKALRGHAEARYIGDIHHGPFDKLLLSVSVDRFGYNRDTHYLFRDQYTRWSPSLGLRMRHDEQYLHLTQWLKYRFVSIQQEYGRGINFDSKVFAKEKREYGIHEILWQLVSDNTLQPFKTIINFQAGKGFARLNVQYNQHFVGRDNMRGIWVHGFGGWLPVYDQPKANVPFTFNGLPSNGFFARDYMFDEWLGGRNAVDGIYAHQIFAKDAELKTLATIGFSKQWMLGGGASVALPFKVIHFYMDAAVYPDEITKKTALSYSGGVAIVLWKDVFEIYLPMLESKDIRESLSYEVRDRWFERVSFQANFKLANPLNLIDHLELKY